MGAPLITKMSREELADYIEEMLLELEAMARELDNVKLQYHLRRAHEETKQVQRV